MHPMLSLSRSGKSRIEYFDCDPGVALPRGHNPSPYDPYAHTYYKWSTRQKTLYLLRLFEQEISCHSYVYVS